jgi:tRNA pseudouridine55 synthase
VNGWLIIDKPVGIGSTDIVSKVKRALREGGYPKLKMGHGGTLDPLASGVLPVALGEATKLAGRMLDADKIYEFTIRFGEETDTLDGEGEVVARSDVRPASATLYPAIARFVGRIEQVPPSFSALKVNGRRAYDLAREGEAVVLDARPVTIHEIQAPAVENWFAPLDEVTLVAMVSKGTYIRSLARDIARASGTVGFVTMLRRLKAGPFTLESAISLDKMGELAKARQLEQALLPLTAGLDDIPALPVTPDQARLLRQGRKLAGIAAKPGLHLATEGSVPVALVELSEGCLRVVRGLNI